MSDDQIKKDDVILGPKIKEFAQLLKTHEYERAAKATIDLLSQIKSRERRSSVYQFLITILRFQSLADPTEPDRMKRLQRYMIQARPIYINAMQEFPSDVALRLDYAKYLIDFDEDRELPFQFLVPFDEDDYAPEGDLENQEHLRLALLGWCYARVGMQEQAIAAFQEAYSERFIESVPQPVVVPLFTMPHENLFLPGVVVEGIIENLKKFSKVDEEILAEIEQKLPE